VVCLSLVGLIDEGAFGCWPLQPLVDHLHYITARSSLLQDWACKNNVVLEPIAAATSPKSTGSDNISNGHDEIIWAITKRDRRFFSASADRTIRVWDAVYGRCLHVLEGHQRPVLSLAATDSHLFSGSYDHTIRAWDMGSMRLVKSMQGTYPCDFV
jgi:F-box and WD-40 domain protein 7